MVLYNNFQQIKFIITLEGHMVSPENIIFFGSGSKVQVLQKNVKNEN